jgi:hypothetical protein
MLYTGGFCGRCNKCGGYCHKASDCHAPSSASFPQFQTTVADTFPTTVAPVSHANPATFAPIAQGPPGVLSYVNNRGQSYRYQGICEYCKRPGYRATHCYDRQCASGDAGNVVFGVGACPVPLSTNPASPNLSLMMVGCDRILCQQRW